MALIGNGISGMKLILKWFHLLVQTDLVLISFMAITKKRSKTRLISMDTILMSGMYMLLNGDLGKLDI